MLVIFVKEFMEMVHSKEAQERALKTPRRAYWYARSVKGANLLKLSSVIIQYDPENDEFNSYNYICDTDPMKPSFIFPNWHLRDNPHLIPDLQQDIKWEPYINIYFIKNNIKELIGVQNLKKNKIWKKHIKKIKLDKVYTLIREIIE